MSKIRDIQSFEQNQKQCILYFNDTLLDIAPQNIIVTDSDETVSLVDTSEVFFETCGLMEKRKKIKEIFKTYGIDYKSFAQVYNEYLTIPDEIFRNACIETAKRIKIRKNWLDFLGHNKQPIVFVTAGITELWNQIINLYQWKNVILIGSNSSVTICPSMKKELVIFLKKHGKKVISFGDSRLDCPMLIESDSGYVISNIRGSIGVSDIVKNTPHIQQIVMEYGPIPDIECCSFDSAIHQVLGV